MSKTTIKRKDVTVTFNSNAPILEAVKEIYTSKLDSIEVERAKRCDKFRKFMGYRR